LLAKSSLKKGEYHDSVSLILLAKKLTELPGILDAAAVTGTEANKGILAEAGLLTGEAQAADANDLVIRVLAKSEQIALAALEEAEALLARKAAAGAGEGEYRPKSINTTVRTEAEANLAVISVAGPHAALVSGGLVGLSLVMLAIIGIALHELVLGGEHVAFIMELPLYHLPNARTICLSVWQRLVAFLKKAGSIILVVSVVVWALSVLPGGEIESSYLAAIGRLLGPLGALMGLGWQMMVALLTSFVAKENTIATLGVLYSTGEEGARLAEALSGVLTPAAALAFLAVQMLFIPCVATVATVRQETASWRWTAFSVALLLVVSFAVGIAIYQGAMLVGWGV